jgi:predicted Rossmann fold flavoprotein
MSQLEADILVAGGGAAGFFSAIAAAKAAPASRVVLLERSPRLLEKVRISGGGRCNVTHACFDPDLLASHYPRGEKELRFAFRRFQPQDTIRWFESRGVKLKTEADGRMFPISDRSRSIIDCLEQEAAHEGVEIIINDGLESFEPLPEGGWKAESRSGKKWKTRCLILATGSSAGIWKSLESLSYPIIPPVPSLFTFRLKDKSWAALSGISVEDCKLSIAQTKIKAKGILLFTHEGLSGPAVLRLSAWGARSLAELGYRFTLNIQFTEENREKTLEMLQSYRNSHPSRQMQSHKPWDHLPWRLWETLLHLAEVEPGTRYAEAGNGKLRKLADSCADLKLEVVGKSTNKEEFVTAGGLALKAVSFQTMESKLHPGLFFCGEILDIDAITGGFNFQAAWTTGFIAGNAAAGFT